METSAYITNLTTHSTLPLFMCCSSDTHFRVYDIRSQNPLINAVQGHSEYVIFILIFLFEFFYFFIIFF